MAFLLASEIPYVTITLGFYAGGSVLVAEGSSVFPLTAVFHHFPGSGRGMEYIYQWLEVRWWSYPGAPISSTTLQLTTLDLA